MKRSISFGMMLVGVLASGASGQASAQAASRPNPGTTATPRPQPPAAEARRPAGTPVRAEAADTAPRVLINREIYAYDGDGRAIPLCRC